MSFLACSETAVSTLPFTNTTYNNLNLQSNNESKNSCDHDSVLEGICQKCNIFIITSNDYYIDHNTTEYSKAHHNYSSNVIKSSFEKDLKNLLIPEDVKSKVIELDLSSKRGFHRMGVRKSQLFSYIHAAYQSLNYKIDVVNIQKQLQMTAKEINTAVRIITGTSAMAIPIMDIGKRNLSTPIVVISPLSMIENVCRKNDLLEHYHQVAELCKKTITKSDILMERKPEQVSLAILKYYMNLKGITITNFAQNNNITDATLNTRVNEIALIDNTN